MNQKRTVLLLSLLSSLSVSFAEETNWWQDSAWTDPDRPFLYYHVDEDRPLKAKPVAPTTEPPKEVAKPKAEEPAPVKEEAEPVKEVQVPEVEAPVDLRRFKTVKALKAERLQRLERAIMVPSPENIKAQREIDAYMLGLAHRYTDAWNLSRIDAPEYDWSVDHPTSAFALQYEKSQLAIAQEHFLRWLLPQMEVILVSDPGAFTFPSFVQVIELIKTTFDVRTQLIVPKGRVSPEKLQALRHRFADQDVFDSVTVDEKNIAKALAGNVTPAVLFVPHEKAEPRLVEFLAWRQAQRGNSVLTYSACAASTLERRMLGFFEALMDPKARFKPKAWEVMPPSKTPTKGASASQHQAHAPTPTDDCPTGTCGMNYQERHDYLNNLMK